MVKLAAPRTIRRPQLIDTVHIPLGLLLRLFAFIQRRGQPLKFVRLAAAARVQVGYLVTVEIDARPLQALADKLKGFVGGERRQIARNEQAVQRPAQVQLKDLIGRQFQRHTQGEMLALQMRRQQRKQGFIVKGRRGKPIGIIHKKHGALRPLLEALRQRGQRIIGRVDLQTRKKLLDQGYQSP